LGASPGASTAVPIMIGLIEKCFPERIEGWRNGLVELIPSYGLALADDRELAAETIARTAKTLGINT